MLLQRYFKVRQLTVLDQADQVVAVHTDPEATLIQDAYAQIDFPLAEHMVRLEARANTARQLRDRARALERLHGVESEDVQLALEPLVAWFEKLHLHIDLAVAGNDPQAARLAKLVRGTLSADDYRDRHGMFGVILQVISGHDLTCLGLPADFTDRGRQLDATLARERVEASRVLVRVSSTVLLLQEQLDAIPPLIAELEAARRLASVESGYELPGLELAFVRAAAAPRPAPTPVEVEPSVDVTPATPPGLAGL